MLLLVVVDVFVIVVLWFSVFLVLLDSVLNDMFVMVIGIFNLIGFLVNCVFKVIDVLYFL